MQWLTLSWKSCYIDLSYISYIIYCVQSHIPSIECSSLYVFCTINVLRQHFFSTLSMRCAFFLTFAIVSLQVPSHMFPIKLWWIQWLSFIEHATHRIEPHALYNNDPPFFCHSCPCVKNFFLSKWVHINALKTILDHWMISIPWTRRRFKIWICTFQRKFCLFLQHSTNTSYSFSYIRKVLTFFLSLRLRLA